MFTAIYYSFLIAFILPTFAQELRVKSANPEIDYSDEQWLLLRDAIFSHETQGLLDWDSKLDYLFPEIKSFETQTPIFDSLARTPNASKKPSRDTYRMCPLCGKLVSKISVHVRYHKDEYRYPCDQCPQMFKEACNLSKHLQRHEKKRALESENSHHPCAKRIGILKNSKLDASGVKTAAETDQEDPEAYRNPELQGSEYIPTESAQPVLGKLSLRGKEVSDTSDPRLARSLERMAQNPAQATVLPHHLRLEFKVKKYTPTQPAIDLAKPESPTEKKKHVKYPDLGHSNQKKFICQNCSATYKRQAFLEKHMALCLAQIKKSPAEITSSPVPCLVSDQRLTQPLSGYTKRQISHEHELDSSEAKRHKKNFICTLCQREYDRISRLKSHLKNSQKEPTGHSEPQKFECPVSSCKRSIKELQHFKDHILSTHTKYILYKCKVPGCNQKSNHAGTFNRHMRRCHQSADKTELSLEQQTEVAAALEPFLKDFKFKCQICNALFPTQKSLQAHHTQTAH